MGRPSASEYAPAAAGYVSLVPDGDLLELLNQNKQEVIQFFLDIPEEKQDYRYQAGKWTAKEMLLHIADTERVFAYRALTIARGDTAAVFPNMDQELFAAHTDASGRTMKDLADEFASVRDASIFLFKYLSEAQLQQRGALFGYPVSPRGFGYCIVGHPMHHLNILRERYLAKP